MFCTDPRAQAWIKYQGLAAGPSAVISDPSYSFFVHTLRYNIETEFKIASQNNPFLYDVRDMYLNLLSIPCSNQICPYMQFISYIGFACNHTEGPPKQKSGPNMFQ